ncbi:hypothetical protein [Bradyrhizobium sp. 144]|uniref:hypothetical protein n=1 Tax=Bradyrhizobium sp. 144 TaxID=2782620 RepID=UPI001FF9BC08|nr:hypothetical protein [Bradyrhizobium sp. 144]MCK1694259.1 hypothetical protein [Bradyrhizobium sp. 144]
MQIQRPLPGPKDIGAFAADYLPYELPAMASLAHDLLEGDAVLRQSQDGRIGRVRAQVALILEALGCCSQLASIVVGPMTARIWRIALRPAMNVIEIRCRDAVRRRQVAQSGRCKLQESRRNLLRRIVRIAGQDDLIRYLIGPG